MLIMGHWEFNVTEATKLGLLQPKFSSKGHIPRYFIVYYFPTIDCLLHILEEIFVYISLNPSKAMKINGNPNLYVQFKHVWLGCQVYDTNFCMICRPKLSGCLLFLSESYRLYLLHLTPLETLAIFSLNIKEEPQFAMPQLICHTA